MTGQVSLKKMQSLNRDTHLFGKKIASGHSNQFYDPNYGMVHSKDDKVNLLFGKRENSIKKRHEVENIDGINFLLEQHRKKII